MRPHLISLVLLAASLAAPLAAPLAGQQPRQLTADDYARAEKYLGTTTAPLVTGSAVRPT